MVPSSSLSISSLLSPLDCDTLPQQILNRRPVGPPCHPVQCKAEPVSANIHLLTPAETLARPETRLPGPKVCCFPTINTRAKETKSHATVEEVRTAASTGATAASAMAPARHGHDNGLEDGGKSTILHQAPCRTKQPMRSSIACLRCRRSKIKCQNDFKFGTDPSPCDSCRKSGIRCIYPITTAPPASLKRPISSVSDYEAASIDKKRHSRGGHFDFNARSPSFVQQQAGTPRCLPGETRAQQVLSASFLTHATWEEVFAIYRRNFVAELPFLHLATIEQHIRRQAKGGNPEACLNTDKNLVLLGLLTLTARFHPELVRNVAQLESCWTTTQSSGIKIEAGLAATSMTIQESALAASEYFANALEAALGSAKTIATTFSLERVQAMLMLGLYEWGVRKPYGGTAAYMWVGMAIRAAHGLGLGCEDAGRESGPTQSRSRTRTERIRQEVRRRTMFSAFILERMLACGDDRVSIMGSRDLRFLCPPCSEMAFELGDNDTGIAPSYGPSILGCLVQLAGIWEDITKYAFGGERLRDGVPPWEANSDFSRLIEQLNDFDDNLPDIFKFDGENYTRLSRAYPNGTCMYLSLHILYALCRMTMHRENVPCIPDGYDNPEGPIDRQTSARAPDGFRTRSAADLFEAAGQVTELVELCEDKIPQSSMVLFAVWTAALVGMYAYHFPQMDVGMAMVGGRSGPTWADDRRFEQDQEPGDGLRTRGNTATTYRTLVGISQHLSQAAWYVERFDQQDRFYRLWGLDHRESDVRYRRPSNEHDGWHSQRNGMTVSNGTILPQSTREMAYPALDHTESSTRFASPGTHTASSAMSAEGSIRFSSITTASSVGFTPINQPPSPWGHPFASPLAPATMRSHLDTGVFAPKSPHQTPVSAVATMGPIGAQRATSPRSSNSNMPAMGGSGHFQIDEGARMAQQLGDHRFCIGFGPW